MMKPLLSLLPLLFAGVASASVVSVNFVGSAGDAGTLAPGDYAGAASESAFVPNWNNATGASGTLNNLVSSTGAATGISVTYAAGDGVWKLPNTTTGANLAGGANPTMMLGYLDSFSADTPTVLQFSGIPAGQTYGLIVYFDGDNGTAWRSQSMIVSGALTGNDTLTGEDSESTNFNSGAGQNPDGLFQIPVPGGSGNQLFPLTPNNAEGNMVVFTGLSGSDFTLTITPVGGTSTTRRAAVNGVQLVFVPEPGSSALALLAAAGLLARRKR